LPNRHRRLLTLAALASPWAPRAIAQARPIRLVVPYPPGGPLDIVARALADRVKDSLGPVVVENRPGAGGNLGMDLVAKAAPDGLTIGMGAVATHAINPWLYAKIPYDPIRDFTPITLVAQVPNVLVMNVDTAKKLGIANVADLVAYAKKNPGVLNYGSGGNGSAGHLAGEMFKSQAGQHQERQAQGAGRDHREALERHAGSADHCRGRYRLRSGRLRHQHLVRPVRSGEHAGRNDAAPEQSLHGGAGLGRRKGEAGNAAGRALADVVGPVHRLRSQRT
jgi:tripartite-type tricarboxylate transporter receptor subunit TctC